MPLNKPNQTKQKLDKKWMKIEVNKKLMKAPRKTLRGKIRENW